MKFYFSGEEIRAVPEVVLPNACIMLSYYYIRSTSKKRFETLLKSRRKEKRERKRRGKV